MPLRRRAPKRLAPAAGRGLARPPFRAEKPDLPAWGMTAALERREVGVGDHQALGSMRLEADFNLCAVTVSLEGKNGAFAKTFVRNPLAQLVAAGPGVRVTDLKDLLQPEAGRLAAANAP